MFLIVPCTDASSTEASLERKCLSFGVPWAGEAEWDVVAEGIGTLMDGASLSSSIRGIWSSGT